VFVANVAGPWQFFGRTVLRIAT